MDETPQVQEDLGSGGKLKNWLQDNVRIILSVLIVVAIASGIYSYSKRSEAPLDQEGQIASEQAEVEEGEEAVTIIGEEDSEEEGEEVIASAPQEAITEPVDEVEVEQEAVKEDVRVGEPAGDSQASISEETEVAFIQTAVRGDSATTLSRKALRNYLEKNNDPNLTAEHKVYIEDYVRKKMNYAGRVQIDDKMTFEKTLLKEGIEAAKTLNERQLENLKKYSARVRSI